MLTCICCIAFSLFGQDWAPYKQRDSLIHFIAQDSIQIYFGSTFGDHFRPIQSLKVDTTFQNANQTHVIVFRKGFSYHRLWELSDVYKHALLKGFLLGDTAFISAQQSIFSSIDSNGFVLNFPHNYFSGKNWILGQSPEYRLNATCSSVDTITIQGNIDSIAQISIQVFDDSNRLVSWHHLNGNISIGKTAGLLRSLDFTDIDSTNQGTQHLYEPYRFPIRNDSISHNENNNLQAGDEYHYYIFYTGMGPLPPNITPGINTRVVKLHKDTLIGGIRYLELLDGIVGGPPISWPPSATKGPPNSYDTIRIQFNDQSMYASTESGIVRNNILSFFPEKYQVYGLTSERSYYNLYRTSIENAHVSTSPNANDSIILIFHPGVGYKSRIIGLMTEFVDIASNSSFYYQGYQVLVYVRKGSQTWGYPQYLITSNSEVLYPKHLKIYPNPVTDQLIIDSKLLISQVEIFDLKGVRHHLSNTPALINTQSLQPGLYILKISTEEGPFIHKFSKE